MLFFLFFPVEEETKTTIMGNFTSVFDQCEQQFTDITSHPDRPPNKRLHLSFADLSTKVILPQFPSPNPFDSSGFGPRLHNITSKINKRPDKFASPSSNSFFFNHLPTLYCLDRNSKDGKIDISDLRVFSEFVSSMSLRESQLYQMDFGDFLKAKSLIRLKRDFEESVQDAIKNNEKSNEEQIEEVRKDKEETLANKFVEKMLNDKDNLIKLIDENEKEHENDDDDSTSTRNFFISLHQVLNMEFDKRTKLIGSPRRKRNAVISWVLAFLQYNTPEDDELQQQLRKMISSVFTKEDDAEIAQKLMTIQLAAAEEIASQSPPVAQSTTTTFIAQVIFWRWYHQSYSETTRERVFGKHSIELLFHILNKGTAINLPCGSADDLFELLSASCSETANVMIGMMKEVKNGESNSGKEKDDDVGENKSEVDLPALRFVTSLELEMFLNEYFQSVFENMKEWDVEEEEEKKS